MLSGNKQCFMGLVKVADPIPVLNEMARALAASNNLQLRLSLADPRGVAAGLLSA